MDLVNMGWCSRAVDEYNKLPPDVRLEKKLPILKRTLRIWVTGNISI